MKNLFIYGVTGISLLFCNTGEMAYAVDISDNEQYVSKKQYDELKDEMQKLKEQVQLLLQQQSQALPITATQQPVINQPVQQLPIASQPVKQQEKTEQDIAKLQEEVETLKVKNEAQSDGTTGFLLTGYAYAGYKYGDTSNSGFNVGFNPIFLWKLRDDLIFEGELELELEDDRTHVGLEFAQLSYLLNDYITIGAGQFLNPSNYFGERLHPTWINKLPDNPLSMLEGTRLQAGSQLGNVHEIT